MNQLLDWQIVDCKSFEDAKMIALGDCCPEDWFSVVCLDGVCEQGSIQWVLNKYMPGVFDVDTNSILCSTALTIDCNDRTVFTDMSAIAISRRKVLSPIGLCYVAYEEFWNASDWPLDIRGLLQWVEANEVVSFAVLGHHIQAFVRGAGQPRQSEERPSPAILDARHTEGT